MTPKWKRSGNDGEIETTHKGKTWRVRKNYDHNDRHTGEYRIEIKKKNPYGGHDWEWHDTVHGKENAKSRLPESVEEKISLDKKIDIEKAIKKLDKKQQIAVKMYFYQNATFSDIGKKLNLSSSRARQILNKALRRLKHPALGLVESVQPHPEVVKAYKKTLDAEDKAGDYNHRSNKARVTRAANHLSKKIKQHHPDLDMMGKIALRTKLQNMNEEVAAVNTGSIPNPAQTAMGPSRLPIHILRRNIGKPINMTDRRRRKDKHPVLLKRFRNYIDG